MKNNLLKLAAVILTAGMCLTSCSKDEIDTNKASEQYGPARTITASAELLLENTDKAYMAGTGENFNKVLWESNDQLTVNNGTMTMDEIAPDNPCHASFSGTVSANTSLESNKDVYRSVYPASIINSIPANASPVVVTLPATQTYDYTSAVAKINNNYMAAYASVNRGASMVVFQFRNLCSILKVQVTAASGATGVDAQMSRLRFASANGLSGNFNVTFNNGIPSLTPVDASAGNVVEIIYSSPVDISTTKTFFVMLPPLSSEGLVMQVVNGDGTKVVQKEKASATLLRNKVYTTTINEPFGDWGGAISVSDNQRVYFAGGNLQHNFLHNTWRFAHEQYSLIDSVSRAKTVLRAATVAGVTWDVTGATDGSQIPMEAIAVNNVYPYLSNKAQWLKNQDIWTDLFSWGTAGLNTSGALNYGPFNTFWGWVPGANNNGAAWANQQYGGGFGPVGTNYTVYDFSEQHNYTGNLWDWSNVNLATGIPNVTQGACHALDADWGVVHRSELNNRITDASKRGDWRTLSGPEWNYVHYGTKRTEMDGKYKCGMGRIDTSGNGNYMNGVFLIPDKMHWYLMPPGTSFTPGTYTLWTTNTYTYAQFKRLENYGVVFLPAAGARTENIHHIGQIGFYWSSTSNPNTTGADGQQCLKNHQHAYSFKIDALSPNSSQHITGYYTENKMDGNAVRLVRNTNDE